MTNFKTALTSAVFALSVCTAAGAVSITDTFAPPQEASFFDRGDEGWYWYHDPLPEEEEKEEKLPVLPPMPVPKETAKSKPQPPAPFSLAWVKAMLPKYMETAWNNPTKENVEAYFLIQRFAMDRANAFADMAQKVVVGNMALDETVRRPTSSPGATAADLQYSANVHKYIKKIGEHAGLWFFYKSTCRFCEAQAPILGYLESEGISVMAISMDGGKLRSRQFANTYLDQGHAAQLGVTATPAMYLVSEDGKFDALGMSVLTLDDLRSRILLVGARNGWISEEELKEASPLINTDKQIDLSKKMPQLLKAATDPASMFGNDASAQKLMQLANGGLKPNQAATTVNPLFGVLSADNFIEPEKLIQLVNGHRAGQFQQDKLENKTEGESDVQN